MRTSKLVNLGSLLLALGVGTATFAQDLAGPAPAGEPVAETAEAEAPVAPAAGVPEAEVPAAPAAGVPEAEVPAAPAAEQAAAEAPAMDAGLAEAAPVPEAEPQALAELDPAPESEPEAEAAVESAEVAEEAAPGESAASVPAADDEPWASQQELEAQELEDPGSETEATPAEEPMVLGALGYDSEGRAGRIHVVRTGDTLWDVSDAYLGTPWVWPSIWQDNQAIENPHLIYPGDRIWISPTEMRKVSEAEAQELLAGAPAAPEPEIVVPEPTEPPAVEVVMEEQLTVLVSDREAVSFVSEETVDASASVLSNEAPRLLISQEDRVWIGLGEGEVRPGDQYTVFRVQERVLDPASKRMLGYHVNLLGWLEVMEVDEESSLALVRQSASEITIGDRLMPREKPVMEIAIQPTPPDVTGQISFLAHQRTHMGSLDYVYLNRGTLDGLEVGSPLQVYREGFRKRDAVRGERRTVPDRVVADLLVVRAQPEVSVALVRHTEEELELGDSFRSPE